MCKIDPFEPCPIKFPVEHFEDHQAEFLRPYLDIIKGLKDQSNLPIAAYHVSGEYAMLKAASMNGPALRFPPHRGGSRKAVTGVFLRLVG